MGFPFSVELVALRLCIRQKSANVRIQESIRDEKGVEENLPFTHDSVETENKNKEVLEC